MSRIRVAIAAVFLLGAASGHAQDIGTPPVAGTIRPERPFRGLFGEPDDRVGRRDRFDVNFSLAASHDDNVLGDQGLQIPDPRVNTDGFYSVASVDGTYQHTGHRVTMGVGGGSSMRYYADLKDLSAAEHHADDQPLERRARAQQRSDRSHHLHVASAESAHRERKEEQRDRDQEPARAREQAGAAAVDRVEGEPGRHPEPADQIRNASSAHIGRDADGYEGDGDRDGECGHNVSSR